MRLFRKLTLRLPKVTLRRVRFSLSTPDTLHALLICVSCDSFAGESSLQTPGLLISRHPSSSGSLNKETFGSPEFPSYPFESMPWSKTPVATSTLALTHSGLLPFRLLQSVGVLPHLQDYPMTTTIHFSGLNTRPGFSFRPASYAGYPVCTWTSLPSGWLTFARVGLSQLRSPTG